MVSIMRHLTNSAALSHEGKDAGRTPNLPERQHLRTILSRWRRAGVKFEQYDTEPCRMYVNAARIFAKDGSVIVRTAC